MAIAREWFDTDGLLDRFETVRFLSDLVSGLATGHGGCVFVVADAGLGKTTLLRRAESMARSRANAGGRRFVLGRTDGVLLGSPHSYRFTDQLLASLGAEGIGLAPVRGQDHASNRYFTAIRILEGFSPEEPVLISLDDMHLADADSLALIEFVCRQVSTRAVGFVGTLRRLPTEAVELARRLESDGYASILELGPLNDQDSLDLFCARTWGDVTRPAIETATASCGGNPLLIEEVARSLLAGSKVPCIEPFSPGRRAILLRRFAGVTDETFRFLRAASVLGTSFRPVVAGRMVELDGPMLDSALEEATATGLFEVDGPSARFVHPIFATAVYEGLQGPLRTELHEAAFRSISQLGGTPAELAEHAIEGGLSDEAALAVIVQSGEEALRSGSWNEAIRFLSVAAEKNCPAPANLERMLAEALAGGGRPREAIVRLEAVVARPEVEGVELGKAMMVLGRAELACGYVSSPRERFEEAARIFEPLDKALAVDSLLRGASVTRFFVGPRETLELARRAQSLAEGLGEVTRLQIEAAVGFASLALGKIEGFRILERAVETIEANGPYLEDYGYSEWWPLSWTVAAGAFVEDFELAERSFELGFGAAERGGWPAPMGGYLVNVIDMLLRQGRIAEAEANLGRLIGLSERAPVLGAAVTLLKTRMDITRGRLADAEVGCKEFETILDQRDVPAPWVSLWTILLRSTLQTAAGDSEEACTTILRAEKIVDETGFVEPCAAPWWNAGLLCFSSAKRFADIEKVVERLDSATSDLPCHWPRAAAHSGRAFLAEASLNADSARELHELALSEVAESGMPLAKAELLGRQGAFLRRQGDLRSARAAFTAAHQIGEACGSGLVTSMAATELRRAGGRVRRRKRPDNGLTTRQSEVAELASQGCTNFEIANRLGIKRKTVEHHLEAVFSTWGLNSRRELMRKVFSGEISFARSDDRGSETPD
jgi:DNA-binding CsgD family transcriptional regulator